MGSLDARFDYLSTAVEGTWSPRLGEQALRDEETDTVWYAVAGFREAETDEVAGLQFLSDLRELSPESGSFILFSRAAGGWVSASPEISEIEAARSSTLDSLAPQPRMRNRENVPQKLSRKINTLDLFTLEPEVNRFREFGPRESGFRVRCGTVVNSPSATTLENNEKISPPEQAENGLCRRLAEERDLGSNLLHL